MRILFLFALLSGCSSIAASRSPSSAGWAEVARYKGDGEKVSDVQQPKPLDNQQILGCDFRLHVTQGHRNSDDVNEVLYPVSANASGRYAQIRFLQKAETLGANLSASPYSVLFTDGVVSRQFVSLDGSIDNNMDSVWRTKILEMRCL